MKSETATGRKSIDTVECVIFVYIKIIVVFYIFLVFFTPDLFTFGEWTLLAASIDRIHTVA